MWQQILNEALDLTILVIDDDSCSLSMLTTFFVEYGINVLVSEDGEDGVRKAKYADLILLDVMMPGINGFDVCQRIKANPETKEIPIIMITALPDIDSKLRAFTSGATDYVTKPFNRIEVMARAGLQLQNKRLKLNLQKASQDLQEVNETLEGIFRSVQDAILTLDSKAKIIKINNSASNLCELPMDTIGKELGELSLDCSCSCQRFILSAITERKTLKAVRVECLQNNRPTQCVRLTTSLLLDKEGQGQGTVIVIRDETRMEELEHGGLIRGHFERIVGRSKAMQVLFSQLEGLAAVATTVLILGESGTGKELIAEALHTKSARRDKPFVKLNCAALSDSMLESELFGHVKGAFTGATGDRIGRFEKAHGGTIFLDEIGDISNQMQLRLLRVLQEQEFERVGDSTPMKVDVRVVAATNQNLLGKVQKGEFRQDLYHRLNVFAVNVPPLRERREDLPLLCAHFINELKTLLNKDDIEIYDEAMRKILSYHWPGNVRELRNALESAMVRCQHGEILAEHLPFEFGLTEPPQQINIEQLEREEIIKILQKTDGNKAKAARLLGMDRTTLYAKLTKYGI